ncbi:TRAP transporter small permease [Alkalihalobacillus sp. 1P02AB]|uniref:TRAP transporter small permease n=1 Tax=Alkalihalobacillus sp. 1P02AB TaxID=3132260 RepID=UPI0039A543BA
MKTIEKLSNWVYSIEKCLAMLFSIVMLIALFLGVIYRYVLNAPLVWSDEMAIYSLVWLTFIGGSMAIKRQESASITILVDRLRGKTKQWLISISILSVLLFSVFILILSVRWLGSPTISLQYSNSMQMPMVFPYLSVPVGFTFITIHSIHLFLLNLKTQPEEAA